MEILVLSYLLASFVFTFLLAIMIHIVKSQSNDRHNKLPPGSLGWPIIGETLEFVFGKPGDFVNKRMIKYSYDIFKTNILGEKTAVICGPEGHKFVFSNEGNLFTEFRPHPVQMLFRSYKKTNTPPPTVIAEETKIVIRQPGFLKVDVLVRFLGVMDVTIQQQLKTHWEGKRQVEAYPLTKSITLSFACKFIMGIDNPERIARLVNHFDAVTLGMHSIISSIPGTQFYRASKAATAIRKELLCVIKEKKEEMAKGIRSSDILSSLIVVTDANGKFMAEAEVADKIMGLLTAGYSTVSTAMVFLMKFVGEAPDIYNKIRAEQMEIAASKSPGDLLTWEDTQKMKYSWNAICETMRLVPPLQGTFREVLQEFTYAGYTIPKGWKVYWTVSSVNMNPKYYPNPNKFDPSRYRERNVVPPYTCVPFGGGPRLCPGKEYARLIILAFIHNVVKKYKWELLFPNEKISDDMIPKPMKGLPIRLHHH